MTFESLDHVSLFAIVGALLMAAGLVMLRKRWLARGANSVGFLIGGWLAILASFFAFDTAWNAELGTTYALGVISLAAYALIAATHEPLGLSNESLKL